MKTVPISPLASAVVLALAASAQAQVDVWTSHGPSGVADVNDVRVVNATAYAATLNGVFRSDDGGTTWQPSGLQRQGILRISPGPGASGLLALADSGTAILYASPDSGLSWQALPTPDAVIAAGVDPAQSSTIYAETEAGQVLRSGDAGATWQSISSLPGVLDFAFGSGGIYARTSDNRFYKSTDAGASWTSVQPSGFVSTAIAVGSAEGVVYAAGPSGFCRSTDSAATWRCLSRKDPNSVSRILEVADASLSTPRLLLAANFGVLISDDGGATWRSVESGFLGSYVQALGSDASGSLVLAGTDTGVFQSPDRGDTWTALSAGLLQSVSISGLALDPSNPLTVWTGSTRGLFRSADGGMTWSSANGSGGLSGQSIATIALDPRQPTTMFVGTGVQLYRTDDGGESWSTPLNGQVLAIAVDPNSSETVLAGGDAGISRSVDGGQTWQPSAIAQSVYALLFDRRDPNRVFAGSYYSDADYSYSYSYGGISGGSIFVSNDHGATFTKNSTQFGSPVNAIVADPFLDGVLYAGGQGVFRSTDGGATWIASTSGLNPPSFGLFVPPTISVGRMVADPVRPGTLYCSTASGLFRSTDGGQSWETFSDGLEPLGVTELAISPDGTKLHAGTLGGGVFERDLATDLTLPCVPGSTRLCLIGGRYAVDLHAWLPEGGTDPGAAQALSDRAGYFALPQVTGSSELPEVAIKMLPAGTLGELGNGAPVFYGSLTTLPYSLIVTDTNAGTRKIYGSRPGAPLCGGADFSFGAAAAAAKKRAAAVSSGGGDVSLLGGRFSVSLEARMPGTETPATVRAMASGDPYAFFSFPDVSGDPQFPEVVVKMIDARSIDGNFWFFHTDLTSLEYTLTVTDSVTGIVKSYEGATPFCGGADTQTFADSP